MNGIDIVLIIIVLLSISTGWKKGFILGLLDLATSVGSILAGLFFYQYLTSFLEKYVNTLGVWTLPVAFIVTIIIARIILSLITKSLLTATPEEVHRNRANQFLGIFPGAINGVLNATILAALLLALPLSDGISNSARDSKMANKLTYPIEWLDERLSPIFDEAIRRSMHKLIVEPGSEKSINLHYSVTNARVREELEGEMLELINGERAKGGLKPVEADPEMKVVARKHSRDMFARGYFSHVTPEGKTLADRVNASNVRFITAGENLALGPTLTICHNGLMNSPGHKANILHKGYGRVGIGILDGGKYGLMITQNFRN